jgi:hypothetical protein
VELVKAKTSEPAHCVLQEPLDVYISVVFTTFKPRVDEKHPWDGWLSSEALEPATKRTAATRAREDIDFMLYILSDKLWPWPWPRGRRKGRSRIRWGLIRYSRVVQMKRRQRYGLFHKPILNSFWLNECWRIKGSSDEYWPVTLLLG